MERYRNSSGNSGVYSFEIGNDYIRVKFSGTTKIYTYSYRKAGSHHVEKMKPLARTSYINSYVKFKYD